jgi:hypothetical protein
MIQDMVGNYQYSPAAVCAASSDSGLCATIRSSTR